MQQAVHWADEVAGRVLASGREPVLSTGISPSGEIHIGNLREVLTADAIYRALLDRGARPRFNYVCDNFDPLRRVYPFLDPQVYASLVGRPLSEIPCPDGRHASYGDHFLEPFLDSLRTLHPGEKIYTFWDYKRNRWPRDAGLRLDHILLSPSIAPRLSDAGVDREVRGWESASDHAPAWAILD